ncbi:hypothetical protein WJX84_010351 [Apatococcus fuscideae]|uniref:CBS domain-containing protein n=1 Tax=Apatococcus fuscideae TaxID=2026836 RepID=A0AAW1T9P2_9CHLO
MTIGQVLRLFAVHNILSAPIFEANSSHCSGFLDLVDILQAVLSWFNVRADAADRTDKLKKAGRKLLTERIRSIKLANDGHLVYRNGSSTTLLEVITSGFLQPVGAREVSHRIAVWDYVNSAEPEDEDAAVDEGGFGVYITNIISQSDIIRFLHQHGQQLGRLGSMTVEALGLATKQVVCVPSDMPTINAFAAMCASHVSCAGVVQLRGHGALVGNLSVSDLRGILPEHFSVLGQPVMTFLEIRRAGKCWATPTPRNPRIQHTTNGCNGWGIKSAEGTQPVRVAACSPDATLLEVIEILVTTRYHRIYVTSEDRRPCGIITLTDILRLIAGRHLSLPGSPTLKKALVPSAPTRNPRRSMSQPSGMEALRNQQGPSAEPLRAVQTTPDLDLTSTQASCPKSPTTETMGKSKHLRQQHIFPHETPSLPGSSRRKWCKVSSDGNLVGREQLP